MALRGFSVEVGVSGTSADTFFLQGKDHQLVLDRSDNRSLVGRFLPLLHHTEAGKAPIAVQSCVARAGLLVSGLLHGRPGPGC